jgi:DNA repair protein SbcC/Rad50
VTAEAEVQDRAGVEAVARANRDRSWQLAITACRTAELDLAAQPDDEEAEHAKRQAEMRLKELVDLGTLLAEADRLDDATSSLGARRDEAAAELTMLGRRLEGGRARLAQISDEREQLQVVLGAGPSRQAELDLVSSRRRDRALLADVEADLGRRRAGVERVEAGLGELRARRGHLTAALDAASLEAAGELGAVEALERTTRRLRQRRELDDRVRALALAHDQVTTARAEADEVFDRFVAGTAPRLASRLRDGEACVVCGSPDHPAPAVGSGAADLVELPQVESAAAAAASAEGDRSRLAGEVDELRRQLGRDADRRLDELADEHQVAQRAVERCRAAAGRVGISRTELAAVDHRLEGLTAEQAELGQQLADLAGRRAALVGALGSDATAAVDVLGARLAAARQAVAALDQAARRLAALGDERRQLLEQRSTDEVRSGVVTGEHARLSGEVQRTGREAASRRAEVVAAIGFRSPDELSERVGAAIAAIDQARGEQATWATARHDLVSARRRRAVALASSAFDDLPAALLAALPEDDQVRLDTQVQAWADDHREVIAALRELDAHRLPDVEPDVGDLQRAAAAASERLRHLASLCGQVDAQRQQAEAALSGLCRCEDDHAEVLERAREVRRAAEVVKGRNRRNATLEAWVLAAHLRDVVDHANCHLETMSSGRYRLAVSEVVADGRSRAGLDLVVHDAFTGRPRSTVTLSGGETFQASLALALGMADVITAGRAGLRLDALFVDEGFGSLDAEALDQAVDVLDALRSRGALVGVVTHVESMKSALPVGIEVRPRADRRGSTVRQHP